MLFSYPVTIPHNTPKDNPLIQRLTITRGVVRRIGIFFPFGCMGLVKCRIRYGDHPVFPANIDGYVYSDNETIEAEYFVYMNTPPYELVFEAYNEDEVFDHTVNVRLNVLPLWALNPFSNQMYEMMQEEIV